MERNTDLLARYLHAVRGHLPSVRQDDILAELSANLRAEFDDKSAELGRPLTEEEQAALLRRHGHPLLVAARYLPQRSLIGPELFPFYWFTIQRILPLVIGVYLLVQAAAIIFGSPETPIVQHFSVGQIITGLFSALFQSLAWITLCFIAVEFFFKGNVQEQLNRPDWDPRKLPKVDSSLDHKGPRHPYADVIASGAFLAWLLVFPRFPVLMFGPTVAWHLLNMDLPAVWHQFYWIVIAFNVIQLISKIALLAPPVRRYYQVIESVIHVLGIAILAWLLRAHDYIGQATFGGNPMSPQTVTTLNLTIHRGLLFVLVFAIAKFLWDTVQWLRPTVASRIANKMGASS